MIVAPALIRENLLNMWKERFFSGKNPNTVANLYGTLIVEEIFPALWE